MISVKSVTSMRSYLWLKSIFIHIAIFFECRKKMLPICFLEGRNTHFILLNISTWTDFHGRKFQLDQNLCESPTQPLRWLHVNLLYLDTDSVPTSEQSIACWHMVRNWCFMINFWLNNIWNIIPQLLYFKFLCCSIIGRYPDTYILPGGCYQFLLLDI